MKWNFDCLIRKRPHISGAICIAKRPRRIPDKTLFCWAYLISPDIKLIRTDTTLDLSQKAEKNTGQSEKIKQSKGLGRNQTIKIPLSHPTGFQNQNNQNLGKIPVNRKH